MAVSDGTAPNEWQCLQFIAVVETQGTEDAATELSRTYPQRCKNGKSYNRQSVEKTIKNLTEWAGVPLLERSNRKLFPTAAGQEFLEAARNIVAEYRIMRGEAADEGLPTLACLPHHTHFVAVAEALLFDKDPVGEDKIDVEYLDQQHRGDAEFYHHAVSKLNQNIYQLIIGPKVPNPIFESIDLYRAQLEAMVPTGYPHGAMSLTELIQEHRMLVPPRDMRSRKLLEQRIQEWGIADPHQRTRIAAETYETLTSVMRLRNETQRVTRRSRVIVVPSDAALAYKQGREFGGLHADKFKWVPIYHTDHAETHLLTMEVCVTRKREKTARPHLGRIIEALQDAVAHLNETDEVGLSGEPFQKPHPELPAQRGGQSGRPATSPTP